MKQSTPPTINWQHLPVDYAGSPLETVFYQSLSVLFKGGESFFCRSLQAYRQDLPNLSSLINDFCKQEVDHSRIHQMLNSNGSGKEWNKAMKIEHGVDMLLRKLSKVLPRDAALVVTVVLENVTASLGRLLLDDFELYSRLSPEAMKLWHYHSEDEVAHEHVALDVMKAANVPDELLITLAPVVQAALIAVLLKVNIQLAIERKSFKGVVRWCRLAKKFTGVMQLI
jgi:predicted metal-dependent hydrolase